VRRLDQAGRHGGGHEAGVADQFAQAGEAVGERRGLALLVYGVRRQQQARAQGRQGHRDDHPDQHQVR
jgi:hypothetical protein